ncbi:MAG: glycosyltransferase [Muribaculaceae bacterium]|nr:glycosyltransferase [Bacteroides sp.]MDE7496048.1 glycosyltransferase [Muribaculaceae bacterium]
MNKTADYELTVIVPVYNEEDNMEAIEKRIGAWLPTSPVKSCVLLVDDGSSDSSLARIKEICSRNPDFYYLAFARNCGLSAAIKAGIDAAESRMVGYIDADLQTDPEDFNLLIPYIGEYELSMGIRANRKDTGWKRMQSKIANGFRRSMTGDGVTDTGCPLKVMLTANARRVPFVKGMHRFLPALFQLQGAKVKEVPVRHYPRVAGKSKFSMSNRLIGPLQDCFAFRWMKARWFNYEIADTDTRR